jgi:hypothetical protein
MLVKKAGGWLACALLRQNSFRAVPAIYKGLKLFQRQG